LQINTDIRKFPHLKAVESSDDSDDDDDGDGEEEQQSEAPVKIVGKE